ncbi:MAG: Clp protease N-terminal domain-containing protein [Dehalococcoidia bacterium]|nr:Clp protease N-terminal domain-containing protein [Dehalococcoidia bacterium]
MPPDDHDQPGTGTRLIPFWNAVGMNRYLNHREWVADADLLAALFDVEGSVLIKILADDGRDVAAARLTIIDIASFARGEGYRGELTPPAKIVMQIAGEEARARGVPPHDEHVLLALLEAGSTEVKGMLAAFGIDRARVLRELDHTEV